MIYLKNKMAVKVTKKVKYAMALYHKIKARTNTFYMESFIIFSKSAHFLDYAALLKQKHSNHDWLCHPWPPFVYRGSYKKVAKGDKANHDWENTVNCCVPLK